MPRKFGPFDPWLGCVEALEFDDHGAIDKPTCRAVTSRIRPMSLSRRAILQ